MKLQEFGLIISSISISTLAQVALKAGMSSVRVQNCVGSKAHVFSIAACILTDPFVILGLALYAAGAAVWLMVLAKLDVSLAYPFVGLGFVMTMVLGYLLLGETLTTQRIAGTALIVAGVLLVARSA